MQTETMTWEFSAGEVCHVRGWLPETATAEAVLCLHGVESHGEWFAEMAAALGEKNVAVYAVDRPGWGQSGGARGYLASYADALRQVAQAATRLRETYARVHLAGLSWGGLLALYAALRRGHLFDSVTLIAPGIFPRRDLSLGQKFRVGTGILTRKTCANIPLPISVDDFTRREDRREYIANDSHRTTAVSASFCLETLKMRKFCAKFISRRNLPATTLLLAGDDAIIDNAKTETLFAERLSPPTGAKFGKVETISDTAHSLVFEAPVRVAETIVAAAARAEREPTGQRVVVIGAGAVGSLVGGLLAWGGHEVTLIARRAHVEAINTHGLTMHIGAGTRVFRERLRAVETVSEISTTPDLIIIAVKSFDTDAAALAAQGILGDATIILSLQNGTENENRIRQHCPRTTILGGAICAYVEFSQPGTIVWSDDRGGLAASIYAAGGDEIINADTRFEAAWHSLMAVSGMECTFVRGDPTSLSVKWSKLMLNVAFNALNALTGLSAGDILAHPEHGQLAAAALREGFLVMAKAGIAPVDLPGYPVTALAKLCKLPVGVVRRALAWQTANDAKGVSSMAQDLRRGRAATKIEIDQINGAVVRAGPAVGVATPANERLCALVREAAESVAPQQP